MLTDIFARRYATRELWPNHNENLRRLLVQGFRLLDEKICPYYVNGKETENGKAFWRDLQSRLSMELGLSSLSPAVYSYQSTWNGQPHTVNGAWTMQKMCENWFVQPLPHGGNANRYIQERLSLVEIGFRSREDQLKVVNAKMDQNIDEATKLWGRHGLRSHGDIETEMRLTNAGLNAVFQSAVEELNTRFSQAEAGLHYHNGFIQVAADDVSCHQIEEPFWRLVADQKWSNVDTDIKDAIDRRDSGTNDAAFYAARALESAIKIISDAKGWTHGGERGAHNFIDNLASTKAGLLQPWEAETLKAYFTNIRNPLSHGPGGKPMPILSAEQTSFAVDSAIVWIKSLVVRSKL